MIDEGLELMAVGMSTVFAFLILLVAAMTATGAFFRKFERYFPEPEPTPPVAGDELSEIAAAIAAVQAFRGK